MRVPAIFCALLLSTLAAAAPKVLVVQLRPDLKENQTHVLLNDLLAREIATANRVDTIAMGEFDLTFRKAIQDGLVRQVPERPTLDEAIAIAKTLGCEYVAMVESFAEDGSLKGKCALYRGSRRIWQDNMQLGAMVSSGNDPDAAARSLARTWALKIDSEAFRDLPTKPRQETPDPMPGDIAPVPAQAAAPPSDDAVDNARLFAEVDRLTRAGQRVQAIAVLRDGVDAMPLDVRRRKALIDALMGAERPEDAAEEARRAALLFPDDDEIRSLAANAWLTAGDETQARRDLNAAIVRDPGNNAARSLLADTCLREMRVAEALSHLQILTNGPADKGTLQKQALAYALSGEVSAMEQSLNRAKGAPEPNGGMLATYALVAETVDAATQTSATDIRSMFQRAIVRREDPEVAEILGSQQALISARLLYLDSWTPPARHAGSHGRRLLALKLLAQSLTGLKAYLSDGADGTLTDARLDLGEALKQLTTARDGYTAERSGNGSLRNSGA